MSFDTNQSEKISAHRLNFFKKSNLVFISLSGLLEAASRLKNNQFESFKANIQNSKLNQNDCVQHFFSKLEDLTYHDHVYNDHSTNLTARKLVQKPPNQISRLNLVGPLFCLYLVFFSIELNELFMLLCSTLSTFSTSSIRHQFNTRSKHEILL